MSSKTKPWAFASLGALAGAMHVANGGDVWMAPLIPLVAMVVADVVDAALDDAVRWVRGHLEVTDAE